MNVRFIGIIVAFVVVVFLLSVLAYWMLQRKPEPRKRNENFLAEACKIRDDTDDIYFGDLPEEEKQRRMKGIRDRIKRLRP